VLTLDDAGSREQVFAALGVRRWAEEVLAGAPYGSVDDLLAAADRTGRLTDAELEEAVQQHPRIGEKPTVEGDAGRLSAAEQSGLASADEGFEAAIARGNRVYEERFGRVFLIRAAGRTPQEVLDELQRRLLNQPEDEAAEAKQQLLEIGLSRLRGLFGADAG
jgi:2-oxo-4-hydroxy-4-carboxy-5-ureidoimidazoline decarboxylase